MFGILLDKHMNRTLQSDCLFQTESIKPFLQEHTIKSNCATLSHNPSFISPPLFSFSPPFSLPGLLIDPCKKKKRIKQAISGTPITQVLTFISSILISPVEFP